VFGDAVAVVAYLNDLARRGQIIITQAAFERLPTDQQVLATRHEIVQVKGEDVPVHRLRLVPPRDSAA
jgi:class 3 adenylate cyclase